VRLSIARLSVAVLMLWRHTQKKKKKKKKKEKITKTVTETQDSEIAIDTSNAMKSNHKRKKFTFKKTKSIVVLKRTFEEALKIFR
jgi:hypothetical protein